MTVSFLSRIGNLKHKVHHYLGNHLPEQRLFLRSDTETRFIRLGPGTQLLAMVGSAVIVGWAVLASAILIMNSIGSGNLRDQAARDQVVFEQRLRQLAEERDQRAEEAQSAHERFNLALAEVSKMQSTLLDSENRRRELETGIGVIQSTLKRTKAERDAARKELAHLTTSAEEDGDLLTEADRTREAADTLSVLADALQSTAQERDALAEEAANAQNMVAELEFDRRLTQERNDRIFEQIEDALTVSVDPLDNMFRSVGLDPDSLLDKVRQGFSGQGGPLTPLIMSTKGAPIDPATLRANGILNSLDKLNLYRLAIEKTPLALPVKSSFRYTSGYGMRWGRMHNGTDFAASTGTPIYATADGVVIHAGWQSGYGRLIKIQHAYGIETRYAHLAKIRVVEGQRVSRGERIGDMGSSGRSTGTHLHYEVRVGGVPVNPMRYIKAARDVF